MIVSLFLGVAGHGVSARRPTQGREEILDRVAGRVARFLRVGVARMARPRRVCATDRDGTVGVVHQEVADAAEDCPANLPHPSRSRHDHDGLLLLRDATDHLPWLPRRRPQYP